MSISYVVQLQSGGTWGANYAHCYGRLNKNQNKSNAISNIKSSTGDRAPVAVTTSTLLDDSHAGVCLEECLKGATCQAYYSWLFNSSPWADAFVTKTTADALKSKKITVTCDVESHYMMSALFAIRTPFLISGFCEMFNTLVDGGLNPCAAKALAYHADGKNNTLRRKPVISGDESNYMTLQETTLTALRKFMAGEPEQYNDGKLGATFATDMRYETRISHLFTPQGNACLFDVLVKRIEQLSAPVSTVQLFTPYDNPFIDGTNIERLYADALASVTAAAQQQPTYKITDLNLLIQAATTL